MAPINTGAASQARQKDEGVRHSVAFGVAAGGDRRCELDALASGGLISRRRAQSHDLNMHEYDTKISSD
jgi:hypothetical protein